MRLIGLFILCLFIFTWGLSSQEVVGFDSRFYLFAQEMWRQGLSWFPTTYGQPYPDYPMLSTWWIVGLAYLYGGLNKLVAVLPTAILAAFTACFTYSIGALQNKRWGMYAVCMLLLTANFLKAARGISLDMVPTAVTAACFYLVCIQRVCWVYPLLLLSFACRGPIGLVIPAGVVCTYYLLASQFKKMIFTGTAAAMVLVLSTLFLLMLAYHVGGSAFAQAVWHMQIGGRIDNAFLPYSYYFTSSFDNYALGYPLACFTLFGVIYYASKQLGDKAQIAFLLQLVGWALVVLVGMSIPGDKKIRYVMPMMPAVALLAAYPLVTVTRQTYFAYLRVIWEWFLTFIPLLLLIVGGVAYFFTQVQVLHLNKWHGLVLGLLMLLQGVALNWRRYAVGIAALSFVLTYLALIEPIELSLEATRDFVMHVENLRAERHAALVFYKEKPDNLPIKYVINTRTMVQPIFIDTLQALMQFRQAAVFVASKEYFASLPSGIAQQFKVVATGAIGHVPVVVFVWGNSYE